jgi:hypothetical protein
MKMISILAATLAAGLMTPPMVAADTLLVQRVQQEAGQPVPSRGMSMDQVRARFGEPASTAAPVGGDRPQHPPITRWNYAGFTVYFERSLVIDSVVNRVSETEKGPRPAQ